MVIIWLEHTVVFVLCKIIYCSIILLQPKCHAKRAMCILFYSILFYSILFYSILFYSILFDSILVKYNGSSLFSLGIIVAPWCCNLQVLARARRRPEESVCAWHADRCATPPPSSSSLSSSRAGMIDTERLAQPIREPPDYLHKVAARHWLRECCCKPPRVPLQMSAPRRRERSL